MINFGKDPRYPTIDAEYMDWYQGIRSAARLLTNDLKESRAAAITAIEVERRRLRRDLHDGLGPTFSRIAFTAVAVAVGEIRQLVYDMRPPALDELGLVAALRQQVTSLQTAQGHQMHVQVGAHDLPILPAAIEVAAFRIATEAVINSARHSGTGQAWVQIQSQNGCLEVSVRDTGSTTGSWIPGVGLSSMRERAAEVGGQIQINTNPEGSLVRALLPIG